MTRVAASFSQYSSRSLPETSALLPTLTNCEMPSPSAPAVSRIASPSAPLCDENATGPAGGQAGANVASRPTPASVFKTPRQLGPTRRMPWRRAHSRSARSRSAPSAPVSLKPAVITTTPFTPFRPHSSRAASTWAAGTTITARSTSPGIAEMLGHASTDCTTLAPGFTG